MGPWKPLRPERVISVTQQRRTALEIIEYQRKNEQVRLQAPHIMVVKRQLIDGAAIGEPEGRRSDIETGQFPPCLVLEPDMELGLDGRLGSLDVRITDDGNVATLGRPLRRQGFSIKKTYAVGTRDGPEFMQICGPYFSVRLKQVSYVLDELSWLGDCRKR